MSILRRVAHLSILLVLVSVAGCAADYHRYSCSGVSYDYCPPAPLPYTVYCGCPTPAAMNHSNVSNIPDQFKNNSD